MADLAPFSYIVDHDTPPHKPVSEAYVVVNEPVDVFTAVFGEPVAHPRWSGRYVYFADVQKTIAEHEDFLKAYELWWVFNQYARQGQPA